MRSYFHVYRGPVIVGTSSGAQQFLFEHPVNGDEELVYIKQFNKARAVLAYNSLGFYHRWEAYDGNGTHLATFSGSQLANGTYIIGPYDQHPEN